MDKRALLDKLKKAFPVVVYREGMTIEDFVHGGGEQRVIRFVENITGTELSTPDTAKLP